MNKPLTELLAEPPIDPTWSMAKQSRTILRRAAKLGLLTYRRKIDMRDPRQVAVVTGELGTDIKLPDQHLPIEDRGLYYFAYLHRPGNKKRQPMLLPEGEVRSAVVLLAAFVGGQEMADMVSFRIGLVPA